MTKKKTTQNAKLDNLASFWDIFSNDEFLSLYTKLWDNRLAKAKELGNKDFLEKTKACHAIINKDIEDFFLIPKLKAEEKIQREVA